MVPAGTPVSLDQAGHQEPEEEEVSPDKVPTPLHETKKVCTEPQLPGQSLAAHLTEDGRRELELSEVPEEAEFV